MCAECKSAVRCKSQAIPEVCESDHFAHFVAEMIKLQQFVISEPDIVRHRNRAAIQQLSAPVATSQFVLAAHYDVSITSQLAKNI